MYATTFNACHFISPTSAPTQEAAGINMPAAVIGLLSREAQSAFDLNMGFSAAWSAPSGSPGMPGRRRLPASFCCFPSRTFALGAPLFRSSPSLVMRFRCGATFSARSGIDGKFYAKRMPSASGSATRTLTSPLKFHAIRHRFRREISSPATRKEPRRRPDY